MRALLVVLGLLVVCQALTGIEQYYYSIFGGGYYAFTAELSADQLVPPQSNTYAGAAVCLLNVNSNPQLLSCQVVHNVPNPLSVTLNFGGVGINGNNNPALTFNNGGSQAVATDFPLSPYNYNSKQILNSLFSGQLSVVVSTGSSVGGVIRGQLTTSTSFWSALTPSQVGDDDDGAVGLQSNSNALGVGLFYYDYVSSSLSYTIFQTVVNYYKSGIYIGALGNDGPLTIPFQSSASPIQQTSTLDSTQQTLLFENALYVNIPSQQNPRGDIRGQITGGTYYVFTQTGLLDDSGVTGSNSQAAGIVLFAYDCAHQILNYFIAHSVLGVKSIGIYGGGSRIFSVPNPNSPAVGIRALTSAQQSDLFSGGFSVRVESNTYPYGEIAGDVTNTTYNYAAILNGQQVSPPVTTGNSGAVVLQYQGNRVVDYAVLINLSNGRNGVTAVEFHQGQPGANNSTVLWSLTNPGSSTLLTEGLRVLDNNQLNVLFSGELYVLVRTLSYPNGELRGQVTRLYGSQCTSIPDTTPCR